MADTYMKMSDTINSHEGEAYITIGNKNRLLFEISSLTAQLELTVSSKRMLGNRMTQHKVVGAEGTGSVTMYFANSQLLNQAIEYLNSGKYKGVPIRVWNEDPQSTVGRQEVVLSNCIFASIPVASLDDNSDDPITFDSDFTYDGIETKSSFKLPGYITET